MGVSSKACRRHPNLPTSKTERPSPTPPFHLELLISNAAATLATSLHRVSSRVLLDPKRNKNRTGQGRARRKKKRGGGAEAVAADGFGAVE